MNYRWLSRLIILVVISGVLGSSSLVASPAKGEKLYATLSSIARSGKQAEVFATLNRIPGKLNWNAAESQAFEGNLRVLTLKDSIAINETNTVYLVRKLTGELFILYNHEGRGHETLKKLSENRLIFHVNTLDHTENGNAYTYATFTETPVQPLFDRIFKISIVLMLILIMVGMGMTLTLKEFALVFKKPKGIIIGQVLQFGLVPLLAVGLGYAAGFHSNYPYIYVGFILIAVSPGGVVSNLMTHYAKGDLALSISITSFSTVLSLFFTPFLLSFYCTNVPDVSIPVPLVVLTITLLVILPLITGMVIRGRWKSFAEKATPFFSALGIITVVFIMVAGVITNLDKVADTSRYGVPFYLMVFLLTLLGMVMGGVVPKLFGVSNYQSRAIALETGLRNSALAMTLAILIQDQMGDFYSSMFVVSGVFGLLMFVSGLITILMFDYVLPLAGKPVYQKQTLIQVEPPPAREAVHPTEDRPVIF